MPNYEKMYYTLFNSITDALRLLEQEKTTDAVIVLATAQCKTEEMYMADE